MAQTLGKRVAELEQQLAELTKRFEEFAARPVHDPFRPIGPRRDAEPLFPPTPRKLPPAKPWPWHERIN